MILCTFLTILMSCSNSEKYEKISGEWECSSWISQSTGIDNCKNNVHFNFQTDKIYSSTLGVAIDTGNYRILNDMLYVTPNGKVEFVVKITRLDNDTLVFLMNQAGDEEILTLVRQN